MDRCPAAPNTQAPSPPCKTTPESTSSGLTNSLKRDKAYVTVRHCRNSDELEVFIRVEVGISEGISIYVLVPFDLGRQTRSRSEGLYSRFRDAYAVSRRDQLVVPPHVLDHFASSGEEGGQIRYVGLRERQQVNVPSTVFGCVEVMLTSI